MTTTETPSDAPITPGSPPPKASLAGEPAKRVPQRGLRKRVLGDGEGDYCIHEIIPTGSKLPAGALLPIPKIPRFIDVAAAMKWIRNESGDLLAGKQVMIFRACEILSLTVQQKPVVVIQSKPKKTMNEPKQPETSDG